MEDISKMANKQDLIAEVAAKTGLTKKDSEKAVNAFGSIDRFWYFRNSRTRSS